MGRSQWTGRRRLHLQLERERGLYLPNLFCPEINRHACDISTFTAKVLITTCKATCYCLPFLPDALETGASLWKCYGFLFSFSFSLSFLRLFPPPPSSHAPFPCLPIFYYAFPDCHGRCLNIYPSKFQEFDFGDFLLQQVCLLLINSENSWLSSESLLGVLSAPVCVPSHLAC